MKLIVTAKGEAKDTQSSRAGIYVLGPNPVNGKPHWLQNSSSNAIWYDNENGDWNIGPPKNLGSDEAEIYSPDDVAGPQVAATWKYYNKKWITSDDILVETFVEPGMHIQIIYSKGIIIYRRRATITRSGLQTALEY